MDNEDLDESTSVFDGEVVSSAKFGDTRIAKTISNMNEVIKENESPIWALMEEPAISRVPQV